MFWNSGPVMVVMPHLVPGRSTFRLFLWYPSETFTDVVDDI